MSAATTQRAAGVAPPPRAAGSGSRTPSVLPKAPRPGSLLPGRGATPEPAERPHGTRQRYLCGPGPGTGPGCRCQPCKDAHAAWARHRTRLIAYGRWEAFVDARPARKHGLSLIQQGMGPNTIAALSGVAPSTVQDLLRGGRRGRGPTMRLKPVTARKILAVRPRLDDMLPQTVVDGAATRRRLQALVAVGHTVAALAARLGMTGSSLGRVIRSESGVTAAKAVAVRDLYDELWDKPPVESTPIERVNARHAREHAAARGWALPAAWDDDEIDDPAAKPAEDWQRSQRRTRPAAELAEEALDVMGQGHTREQAAERLGVSVAAVQKAFERVHGAAA